MKHLCKFIHNLGPLNFIFSKVSIIKNYILGKSAMARCCAIYFFPFNPHTNHGKCVFYTYFLLQEHECEFQSQWCVREKLYQDDVAVDGRALSQTVVSQIPNPCLLHRKLFSYKVLHFQNSYCSAFTMRGESPHQDASQTQMPVASRQVEQVGQAGGRTHGDLP